MSKPIAIVVCVSRWWRFTWQKRV